MIIEKAILFRYKKNATTDDPDIDLLFDVISQYIKEMNWIYEGLASQQEIHKLREQRKLKVNCFMLTNFFIHMSKQIGISPDECFPVTIPNFVSTTNDLYIQGSYKPFDPTYCANSDGLYEFDVHCIAMVNHACFDLLLQAKYPLVNDGADIYSSLSLTMGNDQLADFKLSLPYLTDIDEKCPLTGWTLLHQALNQGKFDFALELLKNGAHDNVFDNARTTPLDILNNRLYDPSVSLEFLSKAKEYQDLKIELIVKKRKEQLETENKAARTIQSFWRKRHNTSNISETQELSQNIDLQFNF
ncbi:hypothetical protein Lqui_1102 [Legionella quinlivanii]|uniref:Uncharacterized protein n=1 Tax=Legionella quinlivanii TaxID=45073 RepID=A0A0W0Y6I1_9GAMM|nr:ankyrin repeat domain-containing protein [Legionella quinlivanii]KTD52258.1 hypothetical protein Lqui_1102 [Legionella quinlivanii]SEF74277.1 hypothetical protein SAMN02746093_00950 [Legionella quinlivanii DSM 21216]STY12243.1 Uncharacterised protein [Legionella quinlivanii]